MLTKGGQGRSDNEVEDVGESLASLVVVGVVVLGMWIIFQALGGGMA